MIMMCWQRQLGLLAMFLALTGCTSLCRAPLDDDPFGTRQGLSSSWGFPILGYSSPDGTFHGFQGTVRWMNAAHDSLELKGRRTGDIRGAEPSGDLVDGEDVTLRVPRSEVRTLLYRGSDSSKSTLLGVSVVTILLVGFAAYAFVYFAINYSD